MLPLRTADRAAESRADHRRASGPTRGDEAHDPRPDGPRAEGEHHDVFAAIRKAGFLRARVDGETVDVEAPPPLVRRKCTTSKP